MSAAAQDAPIPRGVWWVMALPLVHHLLWIFLNPGIQWGDGLELAAASATFGVAHPTGYPLYTLLGRAFLLAPIMEPYTALLVMNALIAAAMVPVLYSILSAMAARLSLESRPYSVAVAAVLGGMSAPVLNFATTVEVYGLNALFILLGIRATLGGHLSKGLLLPLILGLALTNHLSSLSLLPLVLCGLFSAEVSELRPPAFVLRWAVLLVTPLLLFYGTLPMRASGDSEGIFWGEPTNMPSLISHLRGGEYGSYQFLMERPGVRFNATTWPPFAFGRLKSSAMASGEIAFGRGPLTFLAAFLTLGLAACFVGKVIRSGLLLPWLAALVTCAALQLAFLLLYNIPDFADYSDVLMVTLLPLVLGGVLLLARSADDRLKGGPLEGRAPLLVPGALLLCALVTLAVPGATSEHGLAVSWRDRVIEALPPDAALVTGVDADTYTFWYEQHAANRRRGILVYGSNFRRFPWFRRSIPSSNPLRDVVGFNPGVPRDLFDHVSQLDELAITPLLEHTRVFTTIPDPNVLNLLARKYRLVPVTNLLTENELLYIVEAGIVNFAPPVLYEIQSRNQAAPTP